MLTEADPRPVKAAIDQAVNEGGVMELEGAAAGLEALAARAGSGLRPEAPGLRLAALLLRQRAKACREGR